MKHIKAKLTAVVAALLLAAPQLHASAGHGAGGQLNIKEVVLGHIKDSYEWHVTDIAGEPVVIHLPVIVMASDGWHAFSSSAFDEHADSAGYRNGPHSLAIAGEGANAGKIVERLPGGGEKAPIDLSVTKTVAAMFLYAALLLAAILIPARWYRRHKAQDPAPKGFTGFIELLVSYMEDNIVKPGVGKDYAKYSPYLLTCFFFIFTCNLMGLMPFPPGGGNVTGNIAVTFFLALCTFVVTQFSGNKHYWKEIFWPDVPTWLKCPAPVIPLIEFVGIFTKPFALMIRLFANIMAGHAIALALTCIIFLVAGKAMGVFVGMTALSVVMSIFMMCLEVLVCFIQAMVFTMLSATFIGLAKAEPHHD